jgi:AraC family transcriptional regulator
MPQENQLPKVFKQARPADGVAFELRWDPMGVLELPGLNDVLIGVHVGKSAKLACQRDGKRFSGTAVHGDIEIVPPHTPMQWEMMDQNDTTLLLNIPEKLLRAVANESDLDTSGLEIRNRFQIRDTELQTLCWAMKREIELGYPSGHIYMDGLILAVASRVVARHSSLAKQFEERHDGLDGRRLKQVLSFIEEQLAEDLSLEKIAAIARISPSHLKTLFRKSMGVPVHHYVIQRRLERAKLLMMQDGMSITEIALAAGFANQSHMARHMRRMLGMPPRVIKRLMAEASNSL